MDIKILGNNILIDDNLFLYSNKLREYNSYRDFVTNQVVYKISKGDVENAKDIANRKFTDLINDIISELSGYEIYNKTVDDFVASNEGYSDFVQAFKQYNETESKVSSKNNFLAKKRIEYLTYRNQGHIRLPGFEIKCKEVNNSYELKTYTELVQYRNDVLIPYVEISISKMISILFDQYISILDTCRQFNFECIKSIDESKANSIINNIDIVDDKRKLLFESINLCPYNLSSYVTAVQYGLFDEGMGTIISTFQLSEDFKDELIKKYEFNQYRIEKLDLTYEKIKNMVISLSYVYGTSEKEIFTNLVDDYLKSIVKKVRKFLVNCEANNKDMRLSLLKSKINIKADYEKSVKGLFESIISISEVECIQNHTNVDFFVEVSDKHSISIFSSYDEILDYIVASFKDCKSDFLEYIIDKEEIKKQEYIKKQEEIYIIKKDELLKPRKQIDDRIVFATIIICVLILFLISIVNLL